MESRNLTIDELLVVDTDVVAEMVKPKEGTTINVGKEPSVPVTLDPKAELSAKSVKPFTKLINEGIAAILDEDPDAIGRICKEISSIQFSGGGWFMLLGQRFSVDNDSVFSTNKYMQTFCYSTSAGAYHALLSFIDLDNAFVIITPRNQYYKGSIRTIEEISEEMLNAFELVGSNFSSTFTCQRKLCTALVDLLEYPVNSKALRDLGKKSGVYGSVVASTY